MEDGFWTSLICSSFNCSTEAGNECSSSFSAINNPDSCTNNILVIAADILLLFILLCMFICKISSKKVIAPSQSRAFSPVSIISAAFNAALALAYFGFGIWTIFEKVNAEQTVFPLHGCLVLLFQGFTWLLLAFTISLSNPQPQHIVIAKSCSILAFLTAVFLCSSSIGKAIVDEEVSVKTVLNMLYVPGSILLLFSAFQGSDCSKGNSEIHDDAFYTPLQGAESNIIGEISSNDNLTPFAKAGLFSSMSFCWLNPLMTKGKQKILGNEDIPQLREGDQARTWYLIFMEQMNKRKEGDLSVQSSILPIIFHCQRKAILISGLFALIKTLTTTTSPLFLIAFIKIIEGNAAFKYEGYALTLGLFVAKIVESLSERQWFFKTRLIGLQVRSLVSAAIYQKQLRLSNSAKLTHSPGEIVNYVTVDAYKVGEFPYWFHQIWTTSLQICLSLLIVYFSVGLATAAALIVLILTVLASSPLAKLQHEYQTELMIVQNRRLKAITEALSNMKILKLYSWETNFKNVIEGLRTEELKLIYKVLWQKGYHIALFWASPLLVAAVTFWTCYYLGITLSLGKVFTFLATLRLVQEPIRLIANVFGAFIEAKVSFSRIVKFLDAPELENRTTRKKSCSTDAEHSVFFRSSEISWDSSSSTNVTLKSINLVVKAGEKIAICGEVGSGKSTLLAAILGEVPHINGIVQVYGKIAYVSQSAWIQTGTIQENILFGSSMDCARYQQTLEKCSLVKDLEMLPFRDLTQIGERGVNLSGGQKQRIQLARALYQNADVYLLDDPFSAVDAHTATSLFNEYVMGALSGKTVLLVTHQVDFLPAFNSILVMMSSGKILRAAPYEELMSSCQEFQDLVHAHHDTSGCGRRVGYTSTGKHKSSAEEIEKVKNEEQKKEFSGDQLIKQEERETGDTGFKPYIQYLKQRKGFLYFSSSIFFHLIFIVGQLIQSYWLASKLQDYSVSRVKLFTVYTITMCIMSFALLLRFFGLVGLGCGASKSIFHTLLNSLFRAPMLFYDSTPVGRIISRVSNDMNVIDLELAFKLGISVGSTLTAYSIYIVMVSITWPIVFLIIPTIYVTLLLQKYYFASAKELMRMNGTTKSALASHLAESIAGALTIRAFGEEDRFFSKNLEFIDLNASANFNSFSANEWLIQRLEILCAIVLSASAFAITLIQFDASSSGFIGMALSFGLSLNVFIVFSVQVQCMLENAMISVERVEQYMRIPGEAPEIIEENRPANNWPTVGKVEIHDLKVRYRPNSPLVLRGINCVIEGGDKIGIVGRTGGGKTTLISVLFRLVEPTEGKVIVDDYDICKIGLHDLRLRFGIIPQDPTLFSGSVRFNLDPLSKHTDHEIWEVLEKCQLRKAIEEKEEGLDSLIVQDGTNWSMGQRQLFCLGRALLKRSRILVLDEATASMDNTTDSILQKTIRTEFADCTVITVAHRIPTVMDCTKVLAISDGRLVEYDEPLNLMKHEGSLFGQLVKEYWSRAANSSIVSDNC